MKDDIRLIYKLLLQTLGSFCLVASAASVGTVAHLKSVQGDWQTQLVAIVLGLGLAALVLMRQPVWLMRPRNDPAALASCAVILGSAVVAVILCQGLGQSLAQSGMVSVALGWILSAVPISLAAGLAVITPMHILSNYLSFRSFYSGRAMRNDRILRRVARRHAVRRGSGSEQSNDAGVAA